MAKKAQRSPGSDDSSEPEKTTTKIEVELLNKARIIAIRKNKFLFDYLDAILRPAIERDYRELFGNGRAKKE